MPEITVTESQRERLETIEGELESAFIDTYGHIRTTDVLQYLLDTYTPPEQQGSGVGHERIATADFGALQTVASDVDGVPGSGIDTETMRGELLSALGVEEFAVRLAELEDGTNGDVSPASGPSAADAAESTDGDDEPKNDTESGSTPGTDGPGSVLSAANQLLTDHEDKWREGGGEEPYEVDLPDGTTETVRTKDDVRGLLFKHY